MKMDEKMDFSLSTESYDLKTDIKIQLQNVPFK
jgi:hypothetical protein